MLKRVKYYAISFVDEVDDHVFRHCSYRLCSWLLDHPWWGGQGYTSDENQE